MSTISVPIMLCCLLIIFYVWSFFIGIAIIVNIIFALFITMVVYFAFGIKYFSTIHVFGVILYCTFGPTFHFIFYGNWERAFYVPKLQKLPLDRLSLTIRQSN